MVGLHAERIVHVPLEDALAQPKLVDPQGEEVAAVEAIGVSFGR
jgi:hypothetical protein